MTDINKLFFELIQVSLGTRICLSHMPSEDEWGELYKMAKKQSLMGICFAGVQKTLSSYPSHSTSPGEDSINSFDYAQDGRQPYTINLPEMDYLRWMGMAAKIQQRNEVVNRQCVELQAKLAADGLKSSILKGQGVASLYGEHLRELRQSGDIDVYVPCGMQKALEYVNGMYGKCEYDYINAHVPVYQDTEVELHWRAQAMTNLFLNRKLQEWFKSPKVQSSILGGKAVLADGSELVVPSVYFNAFYILLHCYHHMFESGLGLRQLMDYYFVLWELDKKAFGETASVKNKKNIVDLFEQFGMLRFAKGVMWIMAHVFANTSTGSAQATNVNANPNFFLGIEPDEKEGRFLMNEVMQNGNFGHHDERVKKVGNGKMSELWRNVQHNWHLASHYPSELLWQPVWLAYHFIWKRMIKK